MNFKIDFPYPPVHYKSFNEKNFDKKPNLDLFFQQNKTINIFGQDFDLHDNQPKIFPNYLDKCQKTFFQNKSLKEDLIILLKKIKQCFIEYLQQIGNTTEKLQETQNLIYQIVLQIYYLLKIARQTLEAPLKLKKVLQNEKTNIENIIKIYKEQFEKLDKKIKEQIINKNTIKL